MSTAMDDQLISPVMAFKLLLRNDILFDEILPWGSSWFAFRRNRAVERVDALDRNVVRIAKAVLKKLRSGVRSGSIRLHGSYKGGKSKLIPLGDQQDGDLDVFERRLEIFKKGRIEVVYERVFCVRGAVMEIINPTAKAPPTSSPALPTKKGPGRRSDKERVIAEAKERMKTKRYPSIQALARELHQWLDEIPDAIRGVKSPKVMSIETIHDHIAPLFN